VEAATADAFARLLRRRGLTAGDNVVAERALTAALSRSTGTAVVPQAVPLKPGGARLAVTDPPDPGCLAWLIIAPTPAAACRPTVASWRSS
jgi:hypothetical protein